MKVEAELVGVDRLEKALKNKGEEIKSAIYRAINDENLAMHETIIKSIHRKKKTGNIYPRGKGHQHQASAPGEEPASDTGNLATGNNSDGEGIRPKIKARNTKVIASIMATASYSMSLEYGTKNMDARPFMRPALKKHTKGIIEAVRNAIKNNV